MSSSLNKVLLIGRLGKDPEVKYLSSGSQVAKFSLATDESYTKDGTKHEKTEWHNIVAFNKLAEIIGEYLKKGKLVYIEGRLQTREWEDNSGGKRRTTEIVASGMQMLGSKDKDSVEKPAESTEDVFTGATDDDIPF